MENIPSRYQQLRRELRSFIIIGIIATLLDFTLYTLFQQVVTYSIAKTFSFLCGTLFTYLLNKFITFKQSKHSTKEAAKFITLYGSTLVANVTVNSLMIMLISTHLNGYLFITHEVTIIISFIAATSVSTVLNFIGQKFWVFKKTASSSLQ